MTLNFIDCGIVGDVDADRAAALDDEFAAQLSIAA